MKTLTFRIHPITLGLAILIGLPTIAIAAGTILTPPVTVTGSQSGALLTATNQGSGGQAIALLGKSPLGRGVVGETSFNSTSTKDREGGVVGIDSSASGTFNAGVRGNSRVGSGVQGVSKSANGIDGQTSSTTGAFGVLGEDLNKTFNGNTGVAGKSSIGTGVEGSSTSGTGVFAKSGPGTALVVSSNGTGATIIGGWNLGLNITTQSGNRQIIGLQVTAGTPIVATDAQSCSVDCSSAAVTANDVTDVGAALYTTSSKSDGLVATANQVAVSTDSSQSTAIFAQNDGGQYPTVQVNSGTVAVNGSTPLAIDVYGPANPEIMQLDTSGNMVISGTLTQSGSPMATVRSSSGETAVSYVPRTTSPVLEDFGEAQLVSGKAYVALDPGFAAIVDRNRSYFVFITPLGDTNGLFVQSKGRSGFEVIETRGGKSTLAFDYRIVAKPLDSNGPRLPLYVKPHAQGRAVEEREQLIRSHLRIRG